MLIIPISLACIDRVFEIPFMRSSGKTDIETYKSVL